MSCSMSGRRVTMPLPRGRKSLPTIFSSTDDFPDDCEPTTTYESISIGLFATAGRVIELKGHSGAYDLR